MAVFMVGKNREQRPSFLPISRENKYAQFTSSVIKTRADAEDV